MPDGQVAQRQALYTARSSNRHGDSIERQINLWLGRRLRALRLERGLTLSDVAERVGVRYQQVAKYELAMDRISVSRLFVLSLALGEPLTRILDGMPGMLADGPEADRVVSAAERAALLRSYGGIERDDIRSALRDLMRTLAQDKGDTDEASASPRRRRRRVAAAVS